VINHGHAFFPYITEPCPLPSVLIMPPMVSSGCWLITGGKNNHGGLMALLSWSFTTPASTRAQPSLYWISNIRFMCLDKSTHKHPSVIEPLVSCARHSRLNTISWILLDLNRVTSKIGCLEMVFRVNNPLRQKSGRIELVVEWTTPVSIIRVVSPKNPEAFKAVRWKKVFSWFGRKKPPFRKKKALESMFHLHKWECAILTRNVQ